MTLFNKCYTLLLFSSLTARIDCLFANRANSVDEVTRLNAVAYNPDLDRTTYPDDIITAYAPAVAANLSIQDLQQQQEIHEREGKFFYFPLLAALAGLGRPCRFQLDDGDDNPLPGICKQSHKCKTHQGTAIHRSCASGFGICCLPQQVMTCGGDVITNGSVFVNPEFPAVGHQVQSCTLVIHKLSSDIAQIRLDFIRFQMAGPSLGTCNRDVFTVTGQDMNNPIPPICGTNEGQHMYIEVGQGQSPVELRAITTVSDAGHRWRIRVTQYRTSDTVPHHCLQHHTGSTGSISSFNYHTSLQRDDAQYMNRLNYMICVRKEAGHCSISYSLDNFGENYEADHFNIVNLQLVDEIELMSTVADDQAGVGPVQCADDYLLLSADKLCGNRLNDGSNSILLTDNSVVTDDSAGQITIKFVTDDFHTGHGFRLYFRQNPCKTRQERVPWILRDRRIEQISRETTNDD